MALVRRKKYKALLKRSISEICKKTWYLTRYNLTFAKSSGFLSTYYLSSCQPLNSTKCKEQFPLSWSFFFSSSSIALTSSDFSSIWSLNIGVFLASSILYPYCLSPRLTALFILLILLTLKLSYLLPWTPNAYLICQFRRPTGISIEGTILFLPLYFPTYKGYQSPHVLTQKNKDLSLILLFPLFLYSLLNKFHRFDQKIYLQSIHSFSSPSNHLFLTSAVVSQLISLLLFLQPIL